MDPDRLIEQLANPTTTLGVVAQIFIVVLAVMVANFVFGRILGRLHARLEKTRNRWDDAFIDAVRRPLRFLVWLVGVAFAAQMLQRNTGAVIFEAVGPIRDLGVIAILAWFLVRLINGFEDNWVRQQEASGERFDRTTADAISKLLRVSVIVTAALISLQTLGFSVSGIMAAGGVGGIVIGFAAKDLLANFFGGLMVYLDRPFAVGDWIRSPDKEIEGTVEHIGWRLTRIRTFDKRPIYVPNAIFTTIAVENPSRMSHRRIYETIGLRYDDLAQMEAVTGAVKSMLESHPEIDTSQTLMVNVVSFGPSSIDFFIYCFTRTVNWVRFQEIKQDVLLRIANIVAEHDAEIAFPTRTLHLPEGVAIKTEESPAAEAAEHA